MTTAFIDHLETLSCTEKNGVITSLTQLARVIELEDTDYNVLWSALEAAGIPTVPSGLDGTGFEALLLESRSARVIQNDKTVDVELVYRHVLEGVQELNVVQDQSTPPVAFPADGQVIYGKSRSSIQQLSTNFYTDWSQPAGPGQANDITITVEHTYPPTDLRYASQPQPIVQGGVIEAPFVFETFSFEGFITTNNPDAFADKLKGKVNQFTWKNKPPRTWLFTEVQFWKVKSGRYYFAFEVQNHPFGWDPFAVFIDPSTGRPPPNLVKDKGYKQVKVLQEVDIDTVFGMQFEGE